MPFTIPMQRTVNGELGSIYSSSTRRCKGSGYIRGESHRRAAGFEYKEQQARHYAKARIAEWDSACGYHSVGPRFDPQRAVLTEPDAFPSPTVIL